MSVVGDIGHAGDTGDTGHAGAGDLASTRELVERARSDPDALGELYRRYVGRVYGFAFRRCGSAEVAEEITSATFECVVRGLAAFRWRGGGFEAWLFRIAATQTSAWFRRARRDDGARSQVAMRELALCGTVAGPDATLAGGGRWATGDVMAALARLRPRYQEALSLRYLSGLSLEDAAAALGCSKPVFSVTLHRAATALRRELGRAEVSP